VKDADFGSGLALIIFSLFGFYFGTDIPVIKNQGLSGAFFPNLLFGVLILCGLSLLYQGWKRQVKVELPKFQWNKLIPWFIILMVYSIVFEYMGFIIATLVFMVLGMLLLGERRPAIIGAVPLISTFGIYYLFSKVFMIVMP